MYCKKCGKEIPDTAIFCTHCGAEVPETMDPAVREAPSKNEYEYRNTAVRTHRFLFWLPAIFLPLLIIAGVHGNLNNQYTNKVPYVPPVSSELPSVPAENDLYIGTVKNGYLSDYSTAVTVGQAFTQFFVDPVWEYTETKGVHYVSFHGTAHDIITEKQVRIAFLFTVDEETFQVVTWYYGSMEQDLGALPDILDKIYRGVK